MNTPEPTPDTDPMADEVLRLRAANAHLHSALAALLGPSAGLRGTLPPCPHCVGQDAFIEGA